MSDARQSRSMDVLEARAPDLALAEAERIGRELFGVEASATPLASERDQNFRMRSGDGREWVLKIANPAEDPAVLDFQTRALIHVADRDPELPVPRVVRTSAGASHDVVEGPDGVRYFARLVTFLPGVPLDGVPHGPALLRHLGQTTARLGRALRGYFHPAAGYVLLWDLKHALRLRERTPLIRDAARRKLVEQVLEHFEKQVLPVLLGLRAQVIHNDVSGNNTVVDPSDLERVAGVIDFGDMVHAPLVDDVAVSATEVMLRNSDFLSAGMQVVAGYHEVEPLRDDELALLPHLIRTRLAIGMAISAWRVKDHPENEAYIAGGDESWWSLLERMTDLDAGFAACCFREACGLSPSANGPRISAWLEQHAASFGPVLDCDLRTARKRLLRGEALAGGEAAPGERNEALLDGSDVGIGAWGEKRPCAGEIEAGASPLGSEQQRTLHLGIDLFAAPGTPVRAPLEGALLSESAGAADTARGARVVLEHRIEGGPHFYTLYSGLDGASVGAQRPGARIERGAALGRIGEPPAQSGAAPHLHFQIACDLLGWGAEFPAAGEPSRRASWRSLSPDPAAVLGIPRETFTAGPERLGQLLERRARLLGPKLELFYDRPLHVVRGEGAWLIDASGRAYLDAYNNVPQVGHCHPAVVEAVARQAATLNTNTRYVYESVLDYAERLTATMPGDLKVCMFMCSGSEANDVAWRIAKTLTGNDGAIVVENAYHGITDAVNDLSPYGPTDAARLAHHVKVLPAPDDYRGPYRRGESRLGERYARHADEAIDALRAAGRAPAMFLLDTQLASSGILSAPEGWLARVFEKVRAAGGLCVADEVQAGFGRAGSHLWGFELHGVVPDMVTLGKPIGNGYPLAAVVTTPEILRAFGERENLFSTFGGNPVACAAGLAVLDVIEREGLLENARRVGGRLRAGLEQTMQRHPLVGDVRGAGLFLGVELVRDPESLEPAAKETQIVMNRMREDGVLVGREGPHANVLKIRPPLVFSEAHADLLVRALDRALQAL